MLLGNGAQLRLLDVDEIGMPASAYSDQEERGRFTGERLFFTNRPLYEAVAKLIARELPYREISEVCGVSSNTVCGIAWRERVSIETQRQLIGRLGFDVARLSLEAIRDRLSDPEQTKKISAKDLAVIHGIATTNAQLLLGGATARIESPDVKPPSHDDYLAYLKNVTPVPTGLTGPAPDQKEALDVATEPAAPGPEPASS